MPLNCLNCGSTLLMALGQLGRMMHYRCRLCGMDGSYNVETIDDDDLDYDDNVVTCNAWKCRETAMSGSAYCRDHKAEERLLRVEDD